MGYYTSYIIFLLLGLCLGTALVKGDDCAIYKTDIVIAMENSDQTNKTQFNNVKCSVNMFISYVFNKFDPKQVRIALLPFAEKVIENDTVEFNKPHDVVTLKKAVRQMKFEGKTYPDANTVINRAKRLFTNSISGTKKVFIYIGTGKTHKSWHVQQHAQLLREKDVKIIAMKMGNDFVDTDLVFNHISVNRQVTPPSRPRLYATADEVLTKSCAACYKPKIDMAILMDSSIFVQESKFPLMKEMVEKFVSQYRIGLADDSVRFAIVTYGKLVNETELFPFEKSTRACRVTKAIAKLNYMGCSDHYLHNALRYTLDHVFTNATERKDAVKMIMVVTAKSWSQRDVHQGKAKAQGKLARKRGIKIFGTSFLSNPTEFTEFIENYWYKINGKKANTHMDKIVKEMEMKTCNDA